MAKPAAATKPVAKPAGKVPVSKPAAAAAEAPAAKPAAKSAGKAPASKPAAAAAKATSAAADKAPAAAAAKAAKAPAAAAAAAAAPSVGGAAKKMAVGSKMPDFDVLDHEGAAVSSAALLESCEIGIVLFHYPRANTPGCHKQACGMRDNHAELKALGFDVYGMSADNPAPQASWRQKGAFPFSLLCDKSRAALKALGVDKGGVSVHRSHFVVAKDGTVLQAMVGVSPGESIEGALAGAKAAAEAAAA